MTEILLVEDDIVDARFVARLLEGPAQLAQVEFASTLQDALGRLEAKGFDAVVLDLKLPDSQGIETLLAVRNLFPHLPVIVLTGNTDESLGVQAVECGAQDYVVKGLVAGELLNRVVRFSIARNKQILHYKSAARTDALTGLANRRAFDDHLEQLHEEFERFGTRFSLLMLDIDHFKRINDKHGHRTGDFVLTQVAQVILSVLRQMDFAARLGGEEFAILLPHASLSSAERIAERLLAEVSDHLMQFEGATLSVQASIGLAEAAPGVTAERMHEQADQALYAAKRNGRNQACYAARGEFFYIEPAGELVEAE